ncbi:GNAT family N-acetyltransferase [Arhodomonas sp. AD133]|uniref:GNAT family N-acetyltransferase n=1 Tax=Arhodomonas sp. AD133 TaxID=3415009 RepID=UPI003EB8B5C1
MAPTSLMILRPLRRDEWRAFRDHLLRLDPDDRTMRFCHAVNDVFVREHCERAKRSGSLVIACFVDDELRGAAEVTPLDGVWPLTAELAMSVEAAYQGQGVGTELLQSTLLAARNRCVAAVNVTCLLDNGRMLHLTRRLGARIVVHHTAPPAQTPPPWRSELTRVERAAQDGKAVFQARFQFPVAQAQLHAG